LEYQQVNNIKAAFSHHLGPKQGVKSRTNGRYSLTLNNPSTLIPETMLESVNKLLKVADANFRGCTGCNIKHTWHVFLSYPSKKSEDQPWHMDQTESSCYYTLAIPLTISLNSGTTKFLHEQKITNNLVGDALVFSGTAWHRGTANNSDNLRIFLFVTASPMDFIDIND
jgi:hypothetical protein